jgi:hypothetical protein
MRLSAEAHTRIAEAASLPAPDASGLLALVPVLGERPLADRLSAYCAAAWGADWRDDGVRLNIRPFIEAEVLAHVPNVKYTVDRGKDVASAPWYHMFHGERRNDHQTTLPEKRTARAQAAE